MSIRFTAACLALAGFSLLAAPVHALSYRLVEAELPGCRGACPRLIVASGTIGQQEHLRLAQFIDENRASGPISQVMVIESPGGFNGGAAMLGTLVRRLKMTVIVGRSNGSTVSRNGGLSPSVCASACVLVLAGGTGRYFVPGSRVGVHRSHTGPTVLDPITRQKVNGTVDYEGVKSAYVRYFRSMGVGQGVADLADKTESSSMYWLSEQEMSKFKLANNVSKRR